MATLSLTARNAALQVIGDRLNANGGMAMSIISSAPALMFSGPIGSSFGTASGGRIESSAFSVVLTGGGTIRASVGMTLANVVETGFGLLLNVGAVGSGADVEVAGLTAAAGQRLFFNTFALEMA